MRVPDLQELAGSLPKVADDSFQGLPFCLVGNGIQIHCACIATDGKAESNSGARRMLANARSSVHLCSPS